MTSVVQDGVETVWRQFHADVLAFVRRRVPTPEDAEDITQLVFLRMIQSIDSLHDTDRLTGWLYAAARNATIDYYRSASRRRELPVGVVPDAASDNAAEESDEESATEQEIARCLLPMIDRLPVEQADALRMVDLAGTSQVAAAATARVSLSGMKSRVQRGRARVRELLLACCHVEQDARGRTQGCSSRHTGGECT